MRGAHVGVAELNGVARGVLAHHPLARRRAVQPASPQPHAPVEARVALERLRSEVSKAMQAESWPITTSIGAVTFPEPPAEIDAALRRADERMYEAKREGKDRVTVVGWGASAGSLD